MAFTDTLRIDFPVVAEFEDTLRVEFAVGNEGFDRSLRLEFSVLPMSTIPEKTLTLEFPVNRRMGVRPLAHNRLHRTV